MPGRSPVRYLAPIALVAFAVALYLVVAGSLGEEEGDSPNRAAERTPTPTPRAVRREGTGSSRRQPRTYVVRAGDTPSAIAERTGVPLAEIERLNPELDPQLLAPGTRVRLRR